MSTEHTTRRDETAEKNEKGDFQFKIWPKKDSLNGWRSLRIQTKNNRSITLARKEGNFWLINNRGMDEFGEDLVESLIEFVICENVPECEQLVSKLVRHRI